MSGFDVLVVDDSPMSLLLTRQVLRSAGIQARTACGASAAREAIASRRPDLILMDLAMPETDGLTLARELRADPTTRDIVLIAHSSLNLDGALGPALDETFDAKVSKGDPSRLVAALPLLN